jgi:prepilin-type processing-associated H-X9-DG protein
MPSLSAARENARRVVCSSNLKTLGLGLNMYLDTYRQVLIPNVNMQGKEYTTGITSSYQNWQSYFTGIDFGDMNYLKPFQLGRLYSDGYISAYKPFYCPTAKVVLTSASSDLSYYTTKLFKYMPPKKAGWGVPAGDARCRSNYMYWTWEKTRASELKMKPIIVDNLLSAAHKKGSKPYGANALFTDGHVTTSVFTANSNVLKFVLREPWDYKSRDYAGFVTALKDLKP